MALITHLTPTNVGLSLLFLSTIAIVLGVNRRSHTTKLKGPPCKNFLFGYSEQLFAATEYNDLFQEWETTYGPVFLVPSILGTKYLALCDPKAVLHYQSGDTYTYRQTRFTHYFFGSFFGCNLLWAEADIHKRQRKALSSAFTNSAVRDLTPVFYDSAYAVKNAWDASMLSTSSNSFVVEVQSWMSHISLDSIGNAGFSHDFESLKGKSPPVVAALDAFGSMNNSISSILVLALSQVFPPLINIPTARLTMIKNISASICNVAGGLVDSAQVENQAGQPADTSIIGTLVRSEITDSASMRMTNDEIKAQAFILILAGYETTAISLTWALIELCRHSEIQQRLRSELSRYSAEDPTWEQLTNGLPYLDAVVCEVLRLYPPGSFSIREAYVDNVLPLSKPTVTAEGQVVDSLFVAKGTIVYVPIKALNRSEVLWGRTAKDFNPNRWLDDSISQQKASEIQGYRHLLTFGNGPRACLGRTFALTELKVVLSVLIRNFEFELPDGPSTKFDIHRSFLERPKVAGQEGAQVPLVIRRVV